MRRLALTSVLSALALAVAAVGCVSVSPKPAARPMRVVLSFDDAIRDHLLIAAPLLEERGWRGVFNIVTDRIGSGERYLTWDDVRELIRRGHEVATHTASHVDLVRLLDAGREAEVRREFAASRDAIAERTGFAPRYMCAPFTRQDGRTARICREESLVQMSVPRFNFGGPNQDDVVRTVRRLREEGYVRADILHHGVSAEDHGGWRPFRNRDSFIRHLNRLADLERSGAIVVTDYDGCVSGCSLKASPWPHHGVVTLSFDDRNLADWERALPLFAGTGSAVSFCISGAIDTNVVSFARKALAAGHEIALHGLHHWNADAVLTNRGAAAYWDAEMRPQIEACRAAGISVRSFAYPNCRHSPETDALFARHGFTRLRGSIPSVPSPNPYDPKGERLDAWRPVATADAFFTPAADRVRARQVSNVILGESYHTDIDDILRAMARAGLRGEWLSLVSHGISPGATRICMKTEWLATILRAADESGVVIRPLR